MGNVHPHHTNNVKHHITKASLKKYRRKIHSSPDAVAVLTLDKGFIEANDVAVEMFEASSREELLKYHPDNLSPKFQNHLGKSSHEVLTEVIHKAFESDHGYADLIFEHITAQAVLKKVPNPNSAEHKIESTTDVDTSLLKPKFDDESSDTLFDSQRLKEKARLERIKFKVLEKQLNEKIQENTQLKNEIFVIQQILDEMKKSNQNETESQFQEKIERIKEKKKKFKTEVERLTNRLKMVEFEKENLKKLM
ncbi:hypothetical protein M0811_10728 [Anaeramoeba ignava]|uniref:PAS domain-containing protein n=1 Tax=Anaeramoeba ignava TaxID=1746090 RepID=A0A9Q0LFQ2_ANAIG|nr:hypothetical protein M0811_10728 [Anaeramoeba ignava]